MFFASSNQPGQPNNIAQPEAIEHPHNEYDRDDDIAAAMGVFVPWAVSIVLHAALVVIAIAIVWIALPEIEQEEQIIPSAVFNKKPNPALSWTKSPRPKETSTSRRSITKEQKITKEITSKVKVDMALIGVEGGATSKAAIFGKGVGMVGPFGDGRFFGQETGNAKHIVYVVDASGSLLDTLPFVMRELRSSITKLSDVQTFAVIFFNENKPILAGRAPGLLPASSENKSRVLKWLEEGHVVPQGQASPIEAVKKALSLKPDLVFLLSDNITGRGRYELSQSQLLAEVSKANASANRGHTKINTIQFIYQDPLTELPGMEPTLKMISTQTGGRHKFVSGRELGIDQ